MRHPDQDGRVDGNGAGRRLSQGSQIQHFIFIDPMQLVNKFFLHEGDDYKAPAKGKCTDVQGAEK